MRTSEAPLIQQANIKLTNNLGSQPIAYPMGIYSVSTPYINDGVTAPYVYDTGGDTEGNHYFFLKAVMTWIGTQQNNESPGTDTSGAWEPLKNFEAIYTDLLIAPNSLVGGAVFNNNLMFSQRGKNASGGDSSEYHLINTSDPMNTSTLSPSLTTSSGLFTLSHDKSEI